MLVHTALIVAGLMPLSSSDICDEPQWWATYEPEYCLIAEPSTVTTPYLSIHVDAGLYVGLHVSGRKLVILNDLEDRKAQVSVFAPFDYQYEEMIQILEEVCGPVEVPDNGVVVCDDSNALAFRQVRFLRNGKAFLWVESGYLDIEPMLKASFEKLVQSVKALGN